MKRFTALVLSLLALAASPSNAQITQTSYQVTLTWTIPAAAGTFTGCVAATPCTFPISRATVANGAACPTTASSYALAGTSASDAANYIDTSVVAGTAYCYVVQTAQGTATSAPSAPFEIAVPSIPPSPGGGAATSTVVTVTVTTVP
jgi:hypothetical protein